MRLSRAFAVSALTLTLSVGSTGCIKKMLTNGQISSTRQASAAFDTIGDYELARIAASAGLVQFEGMHKLAADNEDALFMLTKGWTGYAFGFVEDELEAANDANDDDLALYHQRRAKMAYDRAIFYGLELLGHTDGGFEAAKKNHGTMQKWLDDNFSDKDDDTAKLFWTGYAWMARVNLMKGDLDQGAAYVAELDVGVSMVEQAVKLDPSYNNYAGLIALAAYHSRMKSPPENAQSKELFERALKATGGKTLVVHLNYATKYACMVADKALYEKLLNEVLAADDPDPNQRLTNAIAKRRARRYLAPARMKDACGFDASPAAAPAPSAAPPAASTGG